MNYPLLKLHNCRQGVVIVRQEINSFVKRIDGHTPTLAVNLQLMQASVTMQVIAAADRL